MIMGWGSDSPMTSYMLFHSSNAGKTDWYNPEFYINPTTDEYLDKAMNSLTIEDSYEWWQKAQWTAQRYFHEGRSALGILCEYDASVLCKRWFKYRKPENSRAWCSMAVNRKSCRMDMGIEVV